MKRQTSQTKSKKQTRSRKVLLAGTMVRHGIAVQKLAATALFAVSNVVVAQSLPAPAPANVPGVAATATMPTTLPAGHPAISASPLSLAPDATLPAGHPAMGGVLPPGLGLTMPATGGASTQAAAMKGTLNITAVAARASGASVANEPVTIAFYQDGKLAKEMTSKTDGLGKFTIGDVPLMPPTQVVLSAKHAGLFQQVMTPDLSLDQPVQSAEWKMYEPTEEMPAWTVAMEHMIVEWKPEGDGVRITEMLSTNNPSDLAWIGKKVTSASGVEQHVTMTLPLPPGADKVELSENFDDDASRIDGGKLVTGSPLYPGRTEFRMVYEVPAKGGALELPIVAPAAVGNLIVFVPADDTQVKATGVTGGTPMDSGNGKVRMYTAQNLAAGEVATLAISGIKPAPAAADDGAPDTATTSQWNPRNLAVGGAFLLVLVGAALMLMKKPAPKTP